MGEQQAADPVDLADDVVEPHIHQVQRALHVLDVRRADAEMVFAQPVKAAQFGSPTRQPPLLWDLSSVGSVVLERWEVS